MKRKGVIAAGNRYTAEAGLEILREGGNAFDAVIAATLTSCVAEPTFTSAGGGGFLMAHTKNGDNILFDYFAQTPGSRENLSEIDFYPIKFNFGDAIQYFHIGLGSAAVPGMLAGLFHVHKKLGKMPFRELAAPAIEGAGKGFVITSQLADFLELVREVITSTPDAREIFMRNGQLLKEGDTLKVANYAGFLEFIAHEGIDEFYCGEIAERIAKDSRERGGLLRMEDFKNFRVIERRPLVFSFNGYDVYTNPPPSSGGTLMAFILKLFATHGLEAMKFGDHRHISVLADAMRLTDKAREEAFDGKQYRHGIADSFLNDHFNLYDPVFRQHALKVGTTTHITVADGLGNIACTTTSHGEGCGYIIPGTDIMLNNMLGEEDLNPGGFHRWPPSSRITSMMAPTIAVREGKPVIATGTGGANRIRTAVAQVLINYLYFGMPIEDAVSKPRFHWHERILDIEPGFWPSELERTEVPETDKKVVWQKKAMYFGGNHSIGFDREGTPAGAGDPRRSGIVMEC